MKWAFIATLALALAFGTAVAKEASVWKTFQGNSYRYTEQYAPSWDSRGDEKADLMLQRFDITYSRKSGWEFYVTTRLVSPIDPIRIQINVDGKIFLFEGASAFGKQSWRAEKEFLDAVKNTEQPILVEEVYTAESGFKYNAVINSDGLAAALKWVGELPH